MIPQRVRDDRKALADKICESLKCGTAPWQKPWDITDMPVNAITDKPYKGANILALIDKKEELNSEDPRWCTFKQAQAKGWKVKKGEKGTRIEYWQFDDKPIKDAEGNSVLNDKGQPEMERVVMVKQYTVFNGSQIEGIPKYTPSKAFDPNEKAERVLTESGAKILHGKNKAYYNPQKDFIGLPSKTNFKDSPSYYAAALHELGHWTGHKTRLNRDLSGSFGSESYGREELVAEMTSMFVSMETGIPQTQEHFDQHSAYLGGWIKAIKEDPTVLFRSAADAGRAAEEILKHERIRERDTKEQTQDIEKEVRGLDLLGKGEEVKVYAKPSEHGNYRGQVLHVDKDRGYCVQQVGSVSLVVHKLSTMERVPEKGESVRIVYPEKKREAVKAKVRSENVQKRTRSR